MSVLEGGNRLTKGGGGATGLLNKGGRGRGNRLPGLVNKHAVEFPQVLANNYNRLS